MMHAGHPIEGMGEEVAPSSIDSRACSYVAAV